MKTVNNLTTLLIFSVAALGLVSCNKDNIEDLEKRLAELEAITSMEDSVLFSDLVISSQESMDIMAGRGITNILGMLYISNCTDLTPLEGLKSVEGLSIEIPSGLSSLAGLEGITDLNLLMLDFEDNRVDLAALDGLEAINNLYLSGSVPSSITFPNISSIESFNLDANTNSITLSGFDEISSIDYLYLSNYGGSLEIKGFAKLASVIDLSLNAFSLNISGLNSLTSVGHLGLYGSNLSCSGLNGLKSMDYLSLYGDNITVSGFNGLSTLGGLSFYGVTLDASGFENLEYLNYLDVSIEHGVNGLNKLKSIDNLQLNIGNSDNFLLGLISVENLYLYSYYDRTNGLVSLADLGLTSLQSIGGLSLELNSLESLDGFNFSNSNLQYLHIYNSPKLTDIAALATYTGSLNSLTIYLTALTSLEGFDNVTNISYLDINNNTELNNWCAIKDIFDNIPVNQRYISNNLLNPASSDDITGCN